MARRKPRAARLVRELLWGADEDDEAEYQLYVLRRAGDVAPFERERREAVPGERR
jgi:hypothetical protein